MFLDRRIGLARLKMGINASVSTNFEFIEILFSLAGNYFAYWIQQLIPKLPIRIFTVSPRIKVRVVF